MLEVVFMSTRFVCFKEEEIDPDCEKLLFETQNDRLVCDREHNGLCIA